MHARFIYCIFCLFEIFPAGNFALFQAQKIHLTVFLLKVSYMH